jgi:sterol desaturase/sphingolipid hydroxylase (fatty acid hydroxylase superfamily)
MPMTDWPDASSLLGWMFVLTFLGMAVWETRRPSRASMAPLSLRWFGNIVLFGLTSLVAWLLPFLSSYGAAVIADRHGWGFFHLLAVAPVIALAASFVLLDFSTYWTHRLMHKIPLLWRLHALHHSDTDLDVTTTIRHHPVEVIVQSGLDAMLALLFGFPPEAIALYGGVVLVVQTFHHGNVVLPARLRWLGRLLITPDLHRLHHSMAYVENNSNFGNLVPLWDRLFGTLRRAPEGEFKVGLAEFSGAHFQRFDRLLIQPLAVVPVRLSRQS